MEFQLTLEDLCAAVGLRKTDIPILVDVYTTECSKEEVMEKYSVTPKVIKTMKEKFSKFCSIVGVEKNDGLKLISGIKLELKPRVAMYQHKIKALEALNKKLDKALIEKTVYVDDIVNDIMSEIGAIDPTPFKCEHEFSGTSEYAILDLSDWQCGSKWSASEVLTGAFDNNELARRVERLTKKVVQIVNMHRTTRNIPHLVTNLIGDFIEGEVIWPSQGVNIEEGTAAQLSTCLGLMEKMYATFLTEFETVSAYCVVGNHGRMSSKKNEMHMWNNFDRLLYMFLAERFRNEERINFFISDTSQIGYTLPHAPKWNHVILHGDGINSVAGVPYYGINRAMTKLSDMHQMIIHYTHFGHWHAATQLPRAKGKTYINGALTDASPGATEWLLSGQPSQTLSGLHPDVGATWSYDIHVADTSVREKDENGIFTPYRTSIDGGVST